MAKIIAGVATSHVHAIGAALDNGKSGEPYWQPLFRGFEPSKKWIAEAKQSETRKKRIAQAVKMIAVKSAQEVARFKPR